MGREGTHDSDGLAKFNIHPWNPSSRLRAIKSLREWFWPVGEHIPNNGLDHSGGGHSAAAPEVVISPTQGYKVNRSNWVVVVRGPAFSVPNRDLIRPPPVNFGFSNDFNAGKGAGGWRSELTGHSKNP